MKAVFFALCVFAASAGAAPQRFFIEAELEQARLYVGGETILRVRLARAPGMPYGILRPPPIGDAFEVWSLGPAGVEVPVEVTRRSGKVDLRLTSTDRMRWLRLNQTY